MSRETRTAKSNQTGTFECFQKFLIVGDNRRFYLLRNLLFPIRCDDDDLIDVADAGRHGSDCFNGSRHAGVCPRAHKRLRRADQLPYLYIIPLLHQRVTRRTHVHMHGNVHLGRDRHSLRNTVIGVLMMRHMRARQCLLTIVRHDFSPHFYRLPEKIQTGDSRPTFSKESPWISSYNPYFPGRSLNCLR